MINKIGLAAKRAVRGMDEAVYPKMCICCGRFIDNDDFVCELCMGCLERMNPITRCMKCGNDKKHCKCKRNAYHFEGAVSPFYNAGLAQNALYSYKIVPCRQYADFFAAEMAKTVANEYRGIKFDAVCFVPTKRSTVRVNGFDHSGLLAEKIAEILKIPLCGDILKRKPSGKKQHKLTSEERFKEVRGRYSATGKIKAERILLVDDILTTGASLDECSRQLLFAGAGEVRCVTALLSDREYKPTVYSEKVKYMLINP